MIDNSTLNLLLTDVERPMCVPGEPVVEENTCFNCTCTEEKFILCEKVTDESCLESDKEKCIPFSIFFDDCNVCECAATGEVAACTMKMCPPPVNESEEDIKSENE